MKDVLVTVAASVGWVGAVATVGAYALVSQRRMDANSLRFQAINILGAGLLALSALTRDNWPSMASNAIWAFVGAQALFSARRSLQRAVVRRWEHLRLIPRTRAVLRMGPSPR